MPSQRARALVRVWVDQKFLKLGLNQLFMLAGMCTPDCLRHLEQQASHWRIQAGAPCPRLRKRTLRYGPAGQLHLLLARCTSIVARPWRLRISARQAQNHDVDTTCAWRRRLDNSQLELLSGARKLGISTSCTPAVTPKLASDHVRRDCIRQCTWSLELYFCPSNCNPLQSSD